jgi:hypothetical protein
MTRTTERKGHHEHPRHHLEHRRLGAFDFIHRRADRSSPSVAVGTAARAVSGLEPLSPHRAEARARQAASIKRPHNRGLVEGVLFALNLLASTNTRA